jgi:hypothetical protein
MAKEIDISLEQQVKKNNLRKHKRIKLNIGERRLSNDSADTNGYSRSASSDSIQE